MVETEAIWWWEGTKTDHIRTLNPTTEEGSISSCLSAFQGTLDLIKPAWLWDVES